MVISQRNIGNLIWILSILAIILICLRPAGTDSHKVIRLCIICGEHGLPNILLNVLLYAPLGFGLRLRGLAVPRTMLAGFFLSLSIESAQFWIPGRFPGPIDIASNVIGAGMGGAIAGSLAGVLRPSRAAQLYLAYGWAVMGVGLVLLTGFLFAPVAPKGDVYIGWTPQLGQADRYSGRVLSASIGGTPMIEGKLTYSDQGRSELWGWKETLELQFEAGAAPTELGPLLHVASGTGTGILMVGIYEETVILKRRLRAADFYFAAPDFRAKDLLSSIAPGDTVTLVVQRDVGGLEISTSTETARAGLSVARGWGLLRYPRYASDAVLMALDLLWLIMLMAPLGLWAPNRPNLIAVTGIPVTAMYLVSTGDTLAPFGFLYFCSALTGVGLGVWVRTKVQSMALYGTTNLATPQPTTRPCSQGLQASRKD